MTICIAAITENSKIVCVTDKMLTLNSQPVTKYEITENNKIISLNDKTVALFAGDVITANQILQKAMVTIPSANTVKEIADKVNAAYSEYFGEIIDNALIMKYGFNRAYFMQNQANLDQTLVSTLTKSIMEFPIDVQIIVAGIDTDPHLYVVNGGSVVSYDSVGYALVGSGSTHAQLSLIESKYSSSVTLEQSAFALLDAKRRAEFDPGVGSLCDIVVIDSSVDEFDTSKIEAIMALYEQASEEADAIKDKYSVEIGKEIRNEPASKSTKKSRTS